MGPKMILHTFLLFGNYLPNYTGHLLHRAFWQEFFCVIGRLHNVLSVQVPITHINCLRINFPITHTSVTQKNCFRIICVIISGLIVDHGQIFVSFFSFWGKINPDCTYRVVQPTTSFHYRESAWMVSGSAFAISIQPDMLRAWLRTVPAKSFEFPIHESCHEIRAHTEDSADERISHGLIEFSAGQLQPQSRQVCARRYTVRTPQWSPCTHWRNSAWLSRSAYLMCRYLRFVPKHGLLTGCGGTCPRRHPLIPVLRAPCRLSAH